MFRENKYIKYPLKDGDTLEGVANHLEIDVEFLMLMHNLNVEAFDKIKSRTIGFPKHLTAINVTEEVIKKLEIKHERKTGYVIWPTSFYDKKTYGFSLENYENKDLTNKIHYEIEIIYIKKKSGFKIIEVNRKKLYKNNLEPNTIIEQLANAIGQTVFPIQLKQESNGEIISIENHQEIKERWQEKKEKLKAYYKGEIAEKIISKADIYFNYDHLLFESLSKNWFFNLFFKPIYGSYTTKKEIQYNSSFPIAENNLLEYEITQKLGRVYSKTNKIIIDINAKSIENLASHAEVKYKLNELDNSIFSINGAFKSKDAKIQIELYQQ